MIAKIPVWVVAVFLALLFLGHRQSRSRLVAPGLVAGLALALSGLSLYGVLAAFGAHALPLLAWGLGVTASVALGGRLFGPHGLERVSGRVRIPGSWLPLGLMMGIFAGKFVLGFAQGVGSPVLGEPWFGASASLVFGLLSGGFVARALAVLRCAKAPLTLPLAAPL